ncbi:FIG00566220: hypothetical protein [hydrothermal vent metagenome]|uniref:DUF4258 domain-containing protein n=1 Tax=hydrothermal vent metagenome TaxID=652676 RepID=A0A3B1AU86_9ZZZZ
MNNSDKKRLVRHLSATLEKIRRLVESGDVRISGHGYDELADDGLTAREIVGRVGDAILVEDYPHYPKGASVLVLQFDKNNRPIHVVWGIPKGHDRPAVLVTAYRPDPNRWNDACTERK